MKKIFTILLLFIAIIGLTPIHAYAEQNGDSSPLLLKQGSDNEQRIKIEVDQKEGTSRIKVLVNGEATDFTLETTDKETIIQEIVSRTDLTEEQVRAKIQFAMPAGLNPQDPKYAEYRLKIRERVQEYKNKIDELKEERERWIIKYEEKKRQYVEFKEDWDSARDDWRKFKAKVEDFDSLTPEEQEQVIEKLKKFMTTTLDRMENHVEILERWVEHVNLSNETEEDLLNETERIKDDLEDFRTRVNETETIEDLRDLGQEIREYWDDNKHILKRTLAELSDVRISHLADKLETIADNLQVKIDALEADGEDVSELQELLDSYEDKIDLAKEELDAAKEIYDNINTENQQEQYQQAKEHIKKAYEYLKEAHKSLNTLMNKYRERIRGQEFDPVELSLDDSDDSYDDSDDEDESEDDSDDDSDSNETEEQ